MIFNKSLLKNISKIVQRDFISIIIILLISIILTRSLGLKLYGEYLLIILIPTTAEVILRLKFDYSSVYLISKKIISVSEMFFFQIIYSILVTLVFFIILIIFRYFDISQFFSINFSFKIFLLIIILFFMRILFINFSYLFIQQSNYKIYNFIVVFNSLFNLFLLLFLFNFEKSIFNAILASVISLFFINFFCFLNLLNRIKIKIFFDLNKFKEIFNFSIKHYFIGIIEFIFSNSHQYLISFFYSPSILANFNLSKMIADMSCKPLNAGFSNVFYSELSKDVGKKDARIFLFSTKVLLITLIMLYLTLLIFVDDIVNFLYGEEFKAVSQYFLLIMPASILITLSTIFYSYFSSKGLQKIFLNGVFFSLVFYFSIFFIFENVLAEKSLFLSINLSSFFLIIFLIKNFLKLNNLLISSLLISKYELKLFKSISYRYVFKK